MAVEKKKVERGSILRLSISFFSFLDSISFCWLTFWCKLALVVVETRRKGLGFSWSMKKELSEKKKRYKIERDGRNKYEKKQISYCKGGVIWWPNPKNTRTFIFVVHIQGDLYVNGWLFKRISLACTLWNLASESCKPIPDPHSFSIYYTQHIISAWKNNIYDLIHLHHELGWIRSSRADIWLYMWYWYTLVCDMLVHEMFTFVDISIRCEMVGSSLPRFLVYYAIVTR